MAERAGFRDRYYSGEFEDALEQDQLRTPISPGKRTLTSGLAAPETLNVIFRVPDLASAQAIASAVDKIGDGIRIERDANGVATEAETAVAKASNSSGQSLPEPVRQKFEASLGVDLSSVRVHTGSESAAAAKAVGARAYTMGQDIHFGDGQYGTNDPFAIHLLAHEVAHTVQQRVGTEKRQNKLEVSTPGDAAEVEADRAADAMTSGQPFSISAGNASLGRVVQRDPVRYGRTQVVPASSTGSKKPTAAQKASLQSVRSLVESLEGRADATNANVKAFLDKGIAAVSQIEGHIKTITGNYEKAYKKHESALKTINQNAKSDEAYIGIVMSIGLGLAAPYIGTAFGAVKAVEGGLKGANAFLTACGLDAIEKTAKEAAQMAGKVQKSAEAAAAHKGAHAVRGRADASPLGSSLPSLRKLQLISQVSKLKDGIIKAGSMSVNMKPLDKAATALVRDIAVYLEHGSGTTVSDPVDVVIAKATQLTANGAAAYTCLENVAKGSWEGVTKMASAIKKAAASASVAKMEEQIWIKWIASVPTSQLGLIDELEGTWVRGPYLPKRVLEMLGPHLGHWTDKSDLISLHANAQRAQRAQEQVGKVGTYGGEISVTTYRYGRVMVGGSEFPARIAQVDRNISATNQGYAELRVAVTGTFITGKPAGPTTGIIASRERFGLAVQAVAR